MCDQKQCVKDIFVDNCASRNFANPSDSHYKQFFRWLFDEGVLVVSRNLLNEYGRSCGSYTGTNISALVNNLTREGRLIVFKKTQLNAFVIKKHVKRQLMSNSADHIHIKVVMLSHRRLAITEDKPLIRDINWFPGYAARAVDRPEKIDYRT